MTQKIYTVFDSKAMIYLMPTFYMTKGHAVRAFTDMVNTDGHQFNKYPADFTLFYMGEFDMSTGKIKLEDTLHSLGLAQEYLIQSEAKADPKVNTLGNGAAASSYTPEQIASLPIEQRHALADRILSTD